MTFTLESVMPWGRSFAEYRRMFALGGEDLGMSILGCADGPASFNAEATGRGARVVSCDPLYRFSAIEIRRRIEETREQIMAQTMANRDEFRWTEFANPAELEKARSRAMTKFLGDYDGGLQEGRYVIGELPSLPFKDRRFHLALCSHFLFLYSDHLDRNFHVDSINELARVAGEVRIFPVNNLGGAVSVHLEPVVARLREKGMTVSVEVVPYEFVRGSNRMLRVAESAQGEMSSIRELI